MPPVSRQIRVRLPRTFVARLAAQAAVEKSDVSTLILRAIKADLEGQKRAKRAWQARQKLAVRQRKDP